MLKHQPSVFFLTYDEPLKEVYWEKFKKVVPWAQRVDGVKGFDAAHKACAEQSRTRRFFIVDGDNRVDLGFLRVKISPYLMFSSHVLSWAARNSINGLVYGNGGIKNWSRPVVLRMRSHEQAQNPEMAVDFCFGIRYLQQAQSLSTADIHQTPFQAFRAGFREGVKMSLVDGKRLCQTTVPFAKWNELIPKSNLERLKIWCSIGSDMENGLWAIFGARLGLFLLLNPDWDHKKINDYDWFQAYWEEQVQPEMAGFERHCPLSLYSWSETRLVKKIQELGNEIKSQAHIEIPLLSQTESQFFKSVYYNRPRNPVLELWN